MNREELKKRRAEYTDAAPKNLVRTFFYSKEKLQGLLAEHPDCAGLVFYNISSPTVEGYFSVYSEPLDQKNAPYTEGGVAVRDGDDLGIPEPCCPPEHLCP